MPGQSSVRWSVLLLSPCSCISYTGSDGNQNVESYDNIRAICNLTAHCKVHQGAAPHEPIHHGVGRDTAAHCSHTRCGCTRCHHLCHTSAMTLNIADTHYTNELQQFHRTLRPGPSGKTPSKLWPSISRSSTSSSLRSAVVAVVIVASLAELPGRWVGAVRSPARRSRQRVLPASCLGYASPKSICAKGRRRSRLRHVRRTTFASRSQIGSSGS